MNWSKHIMVISGLLGSILLTVPATKVNGGVLQRPLKSQESIKVQRFLHPMPHELRISPLAYQFSASECSISFDSKALPETKLALKNFKANWQQRYGTALKSQAGKLNIIAGVVKNYPRLQAAAKAGIFDVKYLAERPNSEQAYTIATSVADNKVNVYVVANDAIGLNYGLLTLEQLLQSLSVGSKIVLPQANIVDWPDIKERGFCSNSGGNAFFDKATGRLKLYGDLKLNIHYDWIYMNVSSAKKISYNNDIQVRIKEAKKYFVTQIPILVHMDYLFNPTSHALCNFPEIAAVGKTGKRIYGSQSGKTFCYNNPKSQVVLDQIFEAIARAGLGDRLQVWLGESKSCCHCKKCKGDLRQHFINEVKHIIHAYNKARLINPKMKMDLLFTQSTYPYNYQLLSYIPKDIGIDIYSGSGPANTYKSRIGEYYLTPQAEEIVASGYDTGALPSVGPSILWDSIVFPTFMSQFVKLRMSETKIRGLNRVVVWMSGIFSQPLNLEAVAEFSWNVGGRTSREFIAAWAMRQGMKNPDKIAAIIKKLEYPIRALGAGMRTRSMKYPLTRMVSLLNGKKPHWSKYFEMLAGFEYANHEELARVLKECNTTIKLAQTEGNRELITGTLLVQAWVTIFERYSLFLQTKDATEKAKIVADIKRTVNVLPTLWKNWIKTKKLPAKVEKKAEKGFDQAMSKLNNIGNKLK